MVLLDDLEGPGVRDFGVWCVGKPARTGGRGCDTKFCLPKVCFLGMGRYTHCDSKGKDERERGAFEQGKLKQLPSLQQTQAYRGP